ncbi:MAG: hypothetical protein E6Q97_37455 [Desulfurellales bacterium]|nr:MAG: hypothetical protein E6Q97_37455 [Desulfurellales bacterium]
MESKKTWWSEPSGSVHAALISTVRTLDHQQGAEYELDLHHAKLYGAGRIAGVSPTNYTGGQLSNIAKARLNVCEVVVDTAVAFIATNRPRMMAITDQGDEKLRRKAKLLTRFIDGQFYSTGQYQLSRAVFRDAAVCDNGYQKVWAENGKVCTQRIPPFEIIVDNVDAFYAKPRCMYHVMSVAPEVLAQFIAGLHKDIDPAEIRKIVSKAGRIRTRGEGVNREGYVEVVEAWHLPSGDGADDGRRAMCINGFDVLVEKWTRDHFPIATFRYGDDEPFVGFRGRGIVSKISGLQVKINYLLAKVQEHLKLNAGLIAVRPGTKFSKEKLTSLPLSIVETSGPIEPIVFNSIPQEILGELENTYRKAFEIAGVTQFSAQGAIPSQLKSGIAIDRYNETNSQRFQHISQGYEEFHREVALLHLEAAKELSEQGVKHAVMVDCGDHMESIDWKEVDMPKDSFILKLFPASYFSLTPAAKTQEAIELAQAFPQIQDHLLAMLDFPDISAATSIVNAPYELINHIAEKLLDTDEEIAPNSSMNLPLAIKVLGLHWNRARLLGFKQESLERVQTFIDQCVAMLGVQQQQQPQQPMQPGAEQLPPAEQLPMQGV